jgi:hypothetical protein
MDRTIISRNTSVPIPILAYLVVVSTTLEVEELEGGAATLLL